MLGVVATVGTAEQLINADVLAFLQGCRNHYVQNIRDYTCRFVKHERLEGNLVPEQHIDVHFREAPYSVAMHWVKNAGRAKRISYVKGRWAKNGNEYMLAEPSGILGLLIPGGVKRDIHGSAARAASRRTVDQFGFKNSLELIVKYCLLATDDPEYDLRYVGSGTLGGRECFIVERRLPYTDEDGLYPDRLLRVYIDKEWLVPTGVYAYSDLEKKELLGSYLWLNVRLNPGLSNGDF